MSDLEARLRPLADSLLAPGETLEGCCVATQSSLFKGRMVALVVTPERLVVQGLTRRFEPDGPPLPLTRDRIASAGGSGGEWTSLTLRTVDGQKLKLNMLSANFLGSIAGGDIQRSGVAALQAWFT